MSILITCPPGMAQICKTELTRLGYNGQVISTTSLIVNNTNANDMITLNLRLRTANKVFVILDTRHIFTFDELFDFIENQEWSDRIQTQQPILVEASTYKSQLNSTPSIQSIVKKSITKKLTGGKDTIRIENNNMKEFAITLMLQENQALILLNTSGDSLHRRGYRTETGEAPMKENIAAGLILSSGRRFGQPFYDICCGSGTICIEAALIAKNIAPGLLRSFAFQSRKGYQSEFFETIKTQAIAKRINKPHTIIGSDISPESISKAITNAKNAGFSDDTIDFQIKDCKIYNIGTFRQQSTLISNPPYGQRMQQSDITIIHEHLFSLFEANESKLSGGIFTGLKTIHPHNLIAREQKKLKNGAEEAIFWKKRHI